MDGFVTPARVAAAGHAASFAGTALTGHRANG